MGNLSQKFQRALGALAYSDIGTLDQLQRRLEPPRHPPTSPIAATVAEPAAAKIADTVAPQPTTFPAKLPSLPRQITGSGAPSKATFRDDLMAGVTVSLVAVPQSLAYAQLAGVPAYLGLYAALVPTVVGAFMGSSRQLSTGPVAMTSLLTAASIAPLAARGSDAFVTNVILLALISGIFQIAFGVLRMGVLLNFLSHPVLMGFINAAAIIIGLSQVPTMLGLSAHQSDHFLVDIGQALSQVSAASPMALGFSVTAVVLLLGFRTYAPKLPGVLLTVVSLTAISAYVGYDSLGGQVVGEIPAGLPSFAFPVLEWNSIVALLPAGFVIALISFMEAMSSAKIISIKTRVPWDENRELIGQGLAKIASAFSQSMPVSGSFSRSALNLSAGGRTWLSSVVSAIAVLLTLAFFTSLLYHLPKAVLAAIIIVAVLGLVNFGTLLNAWRARRDDGIAAGVTFASTLAFAPNIQNGIITGILLSLSLMLYRQMRPRVAVLGVNDDGELRDAKRFQLPPIAPLLGALRFDGSLNFVNASFFEDAVLKIEQDNPDMRQLLIKASGINELDASGVEVIRNLVERFRNNGIQISFSGVKHQVREVMVRAGLIDKIGEENLFPNDNGALAALQGRVCAVA